MIFKIRKTARWCGVGRGRDVCQVVFWIFNSFPNETSRSRYRRTIYLAYKNNMASIGPYYVCPEDAVAFSQALLAKAGLSDSPKSGVTPLAMANAPLA